MAQLKPATGLASIHISVD